MFLLLLIYLRVNSAADGCTQLVSSFCVKSNISVVFTKQTKRPTYSSSFNQHNQCPVPANPWNRRQMTYETPKVCTTNHTLSNNYINRPPSSRNRCFVRPRPLPDHRGDLFQHKIAKLVQHDIKDANDNLVAP